MLRSRDLYVPCQEGERHCHSYATRDQSLEAVERCELDESGGYGAITDESTDSVNVAFIYQVQTTAYLTAGTLEGEGLKVLEDELSTLLIARIFDECPVLDLASSSVLSFDIPDYIEIHTIASEPQDFFLNGDERCKSLVDLRGYDSSAHLFLTKTRPRSQLPYGSGSGCDRLLPGGGKLYRTW